VVGDRPPTFGSGGVLALVAAEVEVAQVDQGVATLCFELTKPPSECPFVRDQVRLVVRVIECRSWRGTFAAGWFH
jgi:hypothetical protein